MPIYEYVCNACAHAFETIVTTSRHGGPTSAPVCPACASDSLCRQQSVFAVATSAGRAPAPAAGAPCGRCGDPRGAGACSMN